ncbi:hypothetical protein [Actinocrinis sp.]|uniref:hypothetical protein n=1 Tax=Actinocrinis sp. TaxID=1920516 RepID=UPI002D53215C|nr:hypothetical protein [Actinocrinis sp.]HZP51402.1 hypothetical protein [Actinocrinis sp.]
MVDWGTLANVGTAAGTALLAVATFSSTRSANAAARNAERGLLHGLRPILVPTRWEDPVQKVRFIDGQWMAVRGGRGVLEASDEAVYLVTSLRNVGRGLAVLHGWDLVFEYNAEHRRPEEFHRLTRDIYIAPGDNGFCQVALRDPGAEQFATLTERAKDGQPFSIDVLYGDAEGGQRVITRIGLSKSPAPDSPETEWAISAGRHWNLDRPDPR